MFHDEVESLINANNKKIQKMDKFTPHDINEKAKAAQLSSPDYISD